MSKEKLPNDPILNAAYNTALEWAANWITGAQMLGRSEEVIEFAKNMAMSIRAAKREVGFQQDFFDAIRSDQYMPIAEKEYWLSQEGGRTQRAPDVCPECAGSGKTGSIGLPHECPYCAGTGKRG